MQEDKRVALVCGTDEFGEGFEPLPLVKHEIDLMTSALIEHAQMTIHADSRINQTRSELMTALELAMKGGDQGPPPDVLLFYYSGHAEFNGERLYIAAHKSDKGANATMFGPEELLGLIPADDDKRPREMVFLFDFCYAGAALNQIEHAINGLGPANPLPALTVIAAAGSSDEIKQLDFTDAFIGALTGAPAGKDDRYIPPGILFEEIRRRMAAQGGDRRPVRAPDRGHGYQAFPNSRFVAAKLRRPEERAGSGWVFCGRGHVAGSIIAHLTAASPQEPLALVGAAGSGKSTLLSWLYAAANGDPLPTGPGAPAVPPPGCADLLVDASGSTIESVAGTIAEHYRTGTGFDVAALVAAFAARSGTARILIDSIDRAENPDALAERLLAPLAALPCVRMVVVADRKHGLFRGNTLEMTSPEYSDAEDMVEFVQHVLRHRSGSRWQHAQHEQVRAVVKEIASASEGSWRRAWLLAILQCGSSSDLGWIETDRSDLNLLLAQLRQFDEADPNWGVELLLPVAVAGPAGLPQDCELWLDTIRALGRTEAVFDDLARAREAAGGLLSQPEKGMQAQGWRFTRPEIAEAFVESQDQSIQCHRAFVRAMYERLLSRDETTKLWRTADYQTKNRFPYHARLAGVLEDYLDDPEFLVAMDQESLVSNLISASASHDDKPFRVLKVCERLGDPEYRYRLSYSRMALLAQVQGLDRLAERAVARSEHWTPTLIDRREQAFVFHIGGGSLLSITDSGIGVVDDGVWREVPAEHQTARVTAASIIEQGVDKYLFAGQADGHAWIQSLDPRKGNQLLEGLDKDCRLVACQQVDGAGLLIAGTKGWQWRSNQRTSARVSAPRLRLAGAAAAVVSGTPMIAGHTARLVHIWRADGTHQRDVAPPHAQTLTAITADEHGVYTGDGDGVVHCSPWTGSVGFKVATHAHRVTELRIRSEGHRRTMISTSDRGEILLTDLDRPESAPRRIDLGIPAMSADLIAPDRLAVGTELGLADISLWT